MSELFDRQYNSRTVRTITAATTVLVTDRHIKVGGTTDYSLTLFALSALTQEASFALKLESTGTGRVSVVPGTNETINDSSGIVLNPGDTVLLTYERQKRNWIVAPRYSEIDATTLPAVIVANTNGTTAVNVFGAGGAPRAIKITDVFLTALDTTAGNIVLKNATDTVVTIAKGTTDTALVGQTALANTVVAKGAVVTVVSSSAGDAAVKICYEPIELPA